MQGGSDRGSGGGGWVLGFSTYQSLLLTASVSQLGPAPAGDRRRRSNGLGIAGVALCATGTAQGNQAECWPRVTPSHGGHRLQGSPSCMFSASVG